MDRILILRPAKETETILKQAIDKYKGIFVADIVVDTAKNSAEAYRLFERGFHFAMIFVAEAMPIEDSRSLLSLISTKKEKERPFIVSIQDNIKNLQTLISQDNDHNFLKDLLVDAGPSLTLTFVYDCVRNFLASEERKIDLRILKSIITSVIDVIHQNTQIQLAPDKILEIKSKTSPRNLSSILAFSGDGIQGSITIATSSKLVSNFADNMIGAGGNYGLTMLEDFLAEMSNQIFGVIKQQLSSHGYDFMPSFNVVVGGDKDHVFDPRSLGQYYIIPFKRGEETFELMFCYEICRLDLTKSRESDLVQATTDSVCDIRLVNALKEIMVEIMSANLFGAKAELTTILQQPLEGESTNALLLTHGWHKIGGGYYLALDIPLATSAYILEKMLGMSLADVTPDAMNDTLGELLNQISSNFRRAAQKFGYQYLNIFHGNFASADGVSLLSKTRGSHLRLQFEVDTYPFGVILGLNRSPAETVFDLSDYFKKQKYLALKKPSPPKPPITIPVVAKTTQPAPAAAPVPEVSKETAAPSPSEASPTPVIAPPADQSPQAEKQAPEPASAQAPAATPAAPAAAPTPAAPAPASTAPAPAEKEKEKIKDSKPGDMILF